jgi:hypothetical protein
MEYLRIQNFKKEKERLDYFNKSLLDIQFSLQYSNTASTHILNYFLNSDISLCTLTSKHSTKDCISVTSSKNKISANIHNLKSQLLAILKILNSSSQDDNIEYEKESIILLINKILRETRGRLKHISFLLLKEKALKVVTHNAFKRMQNKLCKSGDEAHLFNNLKYYKFYLLIKFSFHNLLNNNQYEKRQKGITYI